MKQLLILVVIVFLYGCGFSASIKPAINEAKESYSPELALTLGKLSEIAYKEVVHEELEKIGFSLDKAVIEDKATDTNGFIAYSEDKVVLAFRGTQEPEDFLQDLKVGEYQRINELYCDKKAFIHGGFNLSIININKNEKIRKVIEQRISEGREFYITGHSLGGALSNVYAYYLAADKAEIKVSGIYTYGQPIIGNSYFANCLDEVYQDVSFRHVNNIDIITKIKPPASNYQHTQTLVHFGRAGRSQLYNSWSIRDWFLDGMRLKSFDNHKMKNYLELLESNKNNQPLEAN
jgi:triacylglycerol lipase